MTALTVLAVVVGVVLAVATTVNVVRALVIPRARRSVVTAFVDRAVDNAFRLLAGRTDDYEAKDRILAAQAAVFLIAQLGTWLASYLVAFALMLLPDGHGFGTALRESASSMLTLGFASSRGAEPTLVDALAAGTGLVVVALQIAYLPTLYSAFNRRETEVTLLASRAGSPPWGPELLLRTRYGVRARTDDLPEFYAQWERWAADVAESHANYPVLLRFRSPQPLSSWLVGLLAVMDSAAMLMAVSPSRDQIEPRLAIRMGFTALTQIAASLGMTVDPDPDPDGEIGLSYDEFAAAVDALVGVGFPVERSGQDAWAHFRGWRVNYEAVAYELAYRTDQVPAMWSGPRRWRTDPIAVRRPPNRAPGGAVPVPKPPRPR